MASTPPISSQAMTRMVENLRGLQRAVGDLEKGLGDLGRMTRLDNPALRDAVKRQQQLLQIVSNISRSWHDTATTIIQNLRA